MKRCAALLVLALSLASACVLRTGGPPDRSRRFTAGQSEFRVEFGPGDVETAARVESALAVAAAKVARWGGLREPVTVVIHPSHEALERSVYREGYRWLRAWARYDTVELQSPRTWGLFGPSAQELTEMLVHELTHCAMYQASATRASWPFMGVPLWFREGMASFTAGQGYRWLDRDALRAVYQRAQEADDGADPLASAERRYQGESDLVYAAAHWAFQLLVTRYGEERVRAILTGMADGHTFQVAFQEAIGLEQAQFEAEFGRYVRSRGWQ
jgi:hypothetical protein